MGGAMARGWLHTGHAPAELTIAKFPPANRDTTFVTLGCRSVVVPSEACQGADVVVVAVKPWLVETILQTIAPHIGHTPVVSVASGITLGQMAKLLPNAPIFRAIPNTAAQVGASITAVCSQNTTEEERTKIHQLLAELGPVIEVEEDRLDAAMVVGSCGLAFAMRYVRATAQGAVEMGLKPDVATQIAAQTLAGAAAMLQTYPEVHPEAQIDKVTTPGGNTIKGLNKMEELGFSAAVVGGLKACVVPKK